MKRDLNDAWLRGLRPPEKGRLEVWDTRVGGLMLRLTPTGAATWSVRARTHDGKRTRPTLGTWPGLGIAEARKRAPAHLAAIHSGADPVAQKRAIRARREDQPTVALRVAEWLVARETDPAKPLKPRTAAEYRRTMERDVLPRIGTRSLRETTREDWTRLVAAKRREAPAMASLLYRCASAFLGHAEAHGWITSSPLPRKGLAAIAPPPAPRERVLSDGELRAVWDASAQLNPRPRAFVRILILTATREMEVADVAAGEVHVSMERWMIPGKRTKNRLPYTVPLCPLALAEVSAIWPDHVGEVAFDWRLLGAIGGGGFRGFSKLKAKLDALSGVTDWRWHDLRRTARTGMTRLGVSREHAEAAINHVSGRSKLERTYDRHDHAEEVLMALARWQAHVADLITTSAVEEPPIHRHRS
ncbi:integrase [Siccirubricoccus deserti]|uniref:tyrosine-type recombinase/integrase n=1 Tax=Siccirubricoccus deserti TaxID=2013562 RepID=UPI0016479F10|nr:integrase arm-type DNA-binding domain-containing protein [Siccirubricoccus deserti]GGC68903.1 integrase [Siccirubricoccus deserti]